MVGLERSLEVVAFARLGGISGLQKSDYRRPLRKLFTPRIEPTCLPTSISFEPGTCAPSFAAQLPTFALSSRGTWGPCPPFTLPRTLHNASCEKLESQCPSGIEWNTACSSGGRTPNCNGWSISFAMW